MPLGIQGSEFGLQVTAIAKTKSSLESAYCFTYRFTVRVEDPFIRTNSLESIS